MAKQNRRKRSKKGELKVELKCATCYRLFMAARRRDPAYCKPKCRVKAMRTRYAKEARRTGYTDPIIPLLTVSNNGVLGGPKTRLHCAQCGKRDIQYRATFWTRRDPESRCCSKGCAVLFDAALERNGATLAGPMPPLRRRFIRIPKLNGKCCFRDDTGVMVDCGKIHYIDTANGDKIVAFDSPLPARR